MNILNEETKEIIKKIYLDALTKYGPEYMIDTLRNKGISSEDPEVIAFLQELDKMFGIF